MTEYFSLLGLAPTFGIDLPDLEKRYFTAQRAAHPDRLVSKNAAERQAAISRSMQLNEAYETLKNPLKRAKHLLTLQGQQDATPSQELLMETMEVREQLADAQSAAAVDVLAHRNDAAKHGTLEALSAAFAEGRMDNAAQAAVRLAYLIKFEDEIRIRRKMLAGRERVF